MLRSVQENRAALDEMLATHDQLCPLLSPSERGTAQAEQRNLQEKWSSLERSVEKMLHRTDAHGRETSSLLSEVSRLQQHLEAVSTGLSAQPASGPQWDCRKAQELMVANAELKAAQQKHLDLQQLSEALLSSPWEVETKELEQKLQEVREQLLHTEEQVSSHTQSSSNPIMEKMMVVMRDGLAWAKQTESHIEGRRRRVALLPEAVHRQLRDLRKLQSEVMAKQGQLEALVEEVTELLPELDQAEEVPLVRSSLESLEELSNSTTEKLLQAVREIESGLQTREKLSEQMADLDSWVVSHLHREACRGPDQELGIPAEFDRRLRQIQETMAEAERQQAVCEGLLLRSKDIASELSITENCQLFQKLCSLQDDIQAIRSCEKTNKKELDLHIQTVESSKKTLVSVEKSLRQMLADLGRLRFPITSESLQALEPFRHMMLEHKSQVDLLQPWIPQETTRDLHTVISEIHSKMASLEMKSRDHERYLHMRQCVEDQRENIQEQVLQTREESRDPAEKYRLCQTLLFQVPVLRCLCEEARSKLQIISGDLYPSQLTAEQRRLKQNEEALDLLEITVNNNLSLMERKLLKELDLDWEEKAARAFLRKTLQQLQQLEHLEPNETSIKSRYQKVLTLKKTVEARMRAMEVLGQMSGRGSQSLKDLKDQVLSECDSQMAS